MVSHASSHPSTPADHSPVQVMKAACTLCGKELAIIQIPETIPLFGQIIIQTIKCGHCGFKFSDVMSTEFKEPSGFEAGIKNEKDLSTKLVRNSSGTVQIPELGFELEPGPLAEGFFTNMEGLLERVIAILEFIQKNPEHPEQKQAAHDRLILARKCMEGKMPFTVRVLDPFGGSALIGEHVKRFKLSKKEVDGLKKGIFVLDEGKTK